MTKKERGLVFGIGFVLLGIFTFTDLQISQTLFTKNMYGRIFEVIGEIPFTILATIAAVIFFRFRSKKNLAVNIFLAVLSGVLIFLMTFMGGFMTTNYLQDNLGRKLPELVPVIIGLIILAIAVIVVSKIDNAYARQALKYATIAVIYFLTVIIVMNSIKTMWGRMRIREMTDPLTEFTRWYVITPRGGFDNAYASFPSGHTMNSAAVILLTLLPTFLPKLKGKENLLKGIAYAWILIVGSSRIVMGAHFASDVTVGALLSLALFDIITHLVIRNKANKQQSL